MSIPVVQQDPLFPVLKKGNNLRWPVSEADAPARIELCLTPDDTAEALQKAVRAGVRPTIRSSGHCYEGEAPGDHPGLWVRSCQ